MTGGAVVEPPAPPAVARSLVPPVGPVRPLTRRQERVVEGIRRNQTYGQIGSELGIAVSTVEGHVRAIMNLMPNPDNLEPRVCIYLWSWWRAWQEELRCARGEATEAGPGSHR